MAAQIILMSFTIVGIMTIGHVFGLGMFLLTSKIKDKIKNKKQTKENK